MTWMAAVLVAALQTNPQPARVVGISAAGRGASDVHAALSSRGVRRWSTAGERIWVAEAEERADDLVRELRASGVFSVVEVDRRASLAGIPTDPAYPAQWHLASIGAERAWDSTWGSAGVTVAIIDSGIDAAHPELAGRLLPGWNFVAGTSDTLDVLGHGTAVAGVVGAATNNGFQGAGLAGGCPLLPLVVIGPDGWAWYSHIAAAIMKAADSGARIINVSIGGKNPSAVLQEAVDYAWARGCIVFAAAMNDTSTAPAYPAACAHVVAVAATNQSDALASFSNRGPWVDLAAPGDAILTTKRGGGSEVRAGTSFASPLAAGVGALVLSLRPELDAETLVSLLASSCDWMGPDAGAGRLHAGHALEAAGTAGPADAGAVAAAPGGGSCSASGTGASDLGIVALAIFGLAAFVRMR